MIVSELIQKLQTLPPDYNVHLFAEGVEVADHTYDIGEVQVFSHFKEVCLDIGPEIL